ncbi:hypothetical protein OB925_02510 [Aeromonas rivipollensis]|uniref:hypothetical protein n=1 Tax=Aeromonas rivipollensis TaxID=948519 RepID=UPI00259DDCDA|nr:hypothetical protein [Aeromonas rivipollensis]MDM5083736.1 hypothetical protein [Aeromonas rivipollensis]MDM5096114.1 hypothetical protein [Aeromonas rivipollensis]MDM5104333.1 hypothetical protein [Aeromonas rivipollensis]
MSQGENEIEGNYRKNLMIVAATVSIYSIAGGGFDSELVIAGAKLKFTKPQYLEYASIIVLLFLWWRHWLVSHTGRQLFNHSLVCRAAAPNEVKAKAESILTVKTLDLCKELGRGVFYKHYILDGVFVHSIGFFRVSYHINYSLESTSVIEPEVISSSIFAEPIAFVKANFNYRKEWLRLVLFDTYFGDAILPSIMTLIAIITYSYNYITR